MANGVGRGELNSYLEPEHVPTVPYLYSSNIPRHNESTWAAIISLCIINSSLRHPCFFLS